MASGLNKYLGDTLVSKDGLRDVSTLQDNDVVAVLFSAEWSGDCNDYISQLAKVYNDLRATGEKFDVVFASSDRDKEAFDTHYGKMPWLAISYEERSDVHRKVDRWMVRKAG